MLPPALNWLVAPQEPMNHCGAASLSEAAMKNYNAETLFCELQWKFCKILVKHNQAEMLKVQCNRYSNQLTSRKASLVKKSEFDAKRDRFLIHHYCFVSARVKHVKIQGNKKQIKIVAPKGQSLPTKNTITPNSIYCGIPIKQSRGPSRPENCGFEATDQHFEAAGEQSTSNHIQQTTKIR